CVIFTKPRRSGTSNQSCSVRLFTRPLSHKRARLVNGEVAFATLRRLHLSWHLSFRQSTLGGYQMRPSLEKHRKVGHIERYAGFLLAAELLVQCGSGWVYRTRAEWNSANWNAGGAAYFLSVVCPGLFRAEPGGLH